MRQLKKCTPQHISTPNKIELSPNNKAQTNKLPQAWVELDSLPLLSTYQYQDTGDLLGQETSRHEVRCKILKLARINNFNRHKNN
jgi:hypothetical protein